MKLEHKGELKVLGKPLRYYEAAEGESDVGICFTAVELTEFFGFSHQKDTNVQNTDIVIRDLPDSRKFKGVTWLPGRPRPRTCWFVTLSGLIDLILHKKTDYKEELVSRILKDPRSLSAILQITVDRG